MRSRSAACGFGCIHEPAIGPLKRGPAALPCRPSPAQTLVDYSSVRQSKLTLRCRAGLPTAITFRASTSRAMRRWRARMDVTHLPKLAHRVASMQITPGKCAIHFLGVDLHKVCCPAARAIRHHRLHSACARDSSRRSLISFSNCCNTGLGALCSPSWALGGGDAQHDEAGGIPDLQADSEICELNICRA
jgi:hypothetical protein